MHCAPRLNLNAEAANVPSPFVLIQDQLSEDFPAEREREREREREGGREREEGGNLVNSPDTRRQ